ncbi:MAG: rhodanese-like domain-containing protein [Blastocatellia bacterium]
MRNKLNLRKQSIFWALWACLSVACASSAPPPVPVSSSPTPPASRAGQPHAPAAGGHDHATHALEEKMPRIIPEEFKRLLAARQAVVIDVRPAEEYRQGHIPGAINLPMPQIEAGNYPGLPRDKRLISYCA